MYYGKCGRENTVLGQKLFGIQTYYYTDNWAVFKLGEMDIWWMVNCDKKRMGDPYHHEGITNPQRVPPLRTMWNLNSLAVNCDHHSWCLTHCTSGKGKGERIWFTEQVWRKQQPFFRRLLRPWTMSSMIRRGEKCILKIILHKNSLPTCIIHL